MLVIKNLFATIAHLSLDLCYNNQQLIDRSKYEGLASRVDTHLDYSLAINKSRRHVLQICHRV